MISLPPSPASPKESPHDPRHLSPDSRAEGVTAVRARLLVHQARSRRPASRRIVLTDGPHGIRRQAGDADHLGINDSLPSTCFPPAVAVGSSWDPDMAARVGTAVGEEGLAFGVAVVLGPGVNIKRSPLCGRNFEYYSEDPYLSGVLGAAHVNALQAAGPGASVKHFAANNQETRADAGQRRRGRAHVARNLPARLRTRRHRGRAPPR